ncbi:MAG: anti-sigma factor antagonist [Blastococcus sp.]|jgi:anti-anti-sigma factor|nr:anti-sigma factor antagonist [Blastococcus sp.]
MDAEPGLPPAPGAITVEREGADHWVLCLRGAVDTAVATRFTSSRDRRQVVVDAIDAGGVTFISSSGLALLLLCAEASAAAGRHAVLRSASRSVDRALQLAGIDDAFRRSEPGEGPPAPEERPAES